MPHATYGSGLSAMENVYTNCEIIWNSATSLESLLLTIYAQVSRRTQGVVASQLVGSLRVVLLGLLYQYQCHWSSGL
jgi:hypothetical protein